MANVLPIVARTIASGASSKETPVFPPEIFNLIVKRLQSSVDLQAVRLVDSAMKQLAEPFLFNKLYLSYSEQALDNADNIIKHQQCGQHVLTVILNPMRYSEMDEWTYIKKVKEIFRGTNHYEESIKHTPKGYKMRTKKELEMWGTEITQELLLSFTAALNGCANIQRVIVEPRREVKFSRADIDWICPNVAACTLTQEDHEKIMMTPDQVWEMYDQGRTFFEGIMQAMFKSKESIKELVIRSDTEKVEIHPCVFNLDERPLKFASGSLRGLAKLQLTISSSTLQGSLDAPAWREKKISGLLSHAVNLDTLMVSVEDPEGQTFSLSPLGAEPVSVFGAMLLECKFTKLKKLFLENVTANEDEIETFLESVAVLESLVIERCHLRNGLWVKVANCIQEKTSLIDVSLNELYGGFVSSNEDELFESFLTLNENLIWSDEYMQWDRFLAGDTSNPFTEEEMRKYVRAQNTKLRPLKYSTRKDIKCICTKWFGELAKKKGKNVG